MIRINLAPASGSVAQASASASASAASSSNTNVGNDIGGEEYLDLKAVQKKGGLRLALLFVGPLALYFYENQTIPALSSEKMRISKTLEDLKAFNAKSEQIVKDIKRFKEDEAKIQARISSVDKITRDRMREIRVIELVQQIIPEKAWITKLEIDKAKVKVVGYGLSDFEVSTFLEGMTKSALLTDVNLISSLEETLAGQQVKQFEISANAEVSK